MSIQVEVEIENLPALKKELIVELRKQFKEFCLEHGILDQTQLVQDEFGYWTDYKTALLYCGYEIKSIQEAVEWKRFNSSCDVFDKDNLYVVKHKSGKTGINPAALGL